MKKSKISNAVIRRLPRYYRHLEALNRKGIARISSTALGMRTGLTASQIRQDLSCFGEFGQQGYGYNVTSLMNEIADILGMNSNYTAIVVGAGRMAKALVANFPFQKYGITVTAMYDVDPKLVGTTMFDLPVYHIDELPAHLAEHPADIGILTASENAAKDLSNMLGTCGIKGIWNYTNVELHPKTGDPVIENVHLFDSLFSMCCMMNGYEI